jgi:hypothetical protein
MEKKNLKSMFISLLLVLFTLGAAFCQAVELTIHPVEAPAIVEATQERPNQLPHSRVAHGQKDIKAAWLSHPTDRYPHGVLGDALEASRLVVETRSGEQLKVELPATRVFEDLQPRLADLDADNRDEILVVESDTRKGAALSVYGVVEGQLVRRAATPFLGQPNRWLNPLGWGDFDGDGRIDIALVATPHIGGILRLYHFTPPTLTLYGEYRGVSTHRIGSTSLDLGRVVPAEPRDRLLVPDQSYSELLLLEWSENNWKVVAKAIMPGRLNSSLIPAGKGRWTFFLEGGKAYELVLRP